MRLLLVRHGQTPHNISGALDTARPGASLTALGHSQAAALVEAFATDDGLGAKSISMIYVSTLIRTQLTALPLASAVGLEPVIEDGLREISAGSIEMRVDRESQRIYLSTAFAWARGNLDLRMPGNASSGAEDGHEFLARFDAVISRIRESGAHTVVVVSHGAAIRTWVAARCLNTDKEFAADNHLDNTGAAVLESVGDHEWRLDEWRGTPVGGVTAGTAAADPVGRAVETLEPQRREFDKFCAESIGDGSSS